MDLQSYPHRHNSFEAMLRFINAMFSCYTRSVGELPAASPICLPLTPNPICLQQPGGRFGPIGIASRLQWIQASVETWLCIAGLPDLACCPPAAPDLVPSQIAVGITEGSSCIASAHQAGMHNDQECGFKVDSKNAFKRVS
jgi:hypothetical protein